MVVTVVRPTDDPYEHVLADLRRRREELEIAIRAIEAVRSTPTIPSIPTTMSSPALPHPGEAERSLFGLSISEASKKVLHAQGKSMHTTEIVPLLQAGGLELKSSDPVNTVNSVLNRRAASVGDIVRVGRSVWALKSDMPLAQSERGVMGEGPSVTATGPIGTSTSNLDSLLE